MKAIRKDFLPEDLKPILEKNNFDGCIAVQASQTEAETEFLLELANIYSFIKGVVGWVNLNSDGVEERLKYFSANPLFKGVRHTVYDERGEFMEKPEFQSGISHLKKFGLTYDLLVFDYQLAGAINLVKNFPDQKFVLDHLGKPKVSKGVSIKWKNQIEALAEFPNVHCKMSGLFSEAENFEWNMEMLNPYIKIAFEVFGSDRILFGSNWPVSQCAASYAETYQIIQNFLNNDEEQLKLIMGENSRKFYGV